MKKHIIITTLFFLLCHLSCFADTLIVEPDDGRAPLFKAIEQAKSSVQLVVYGFTDTSLMQALARAQNTGKNVRVLLEPHPYKSEDENNSAIQFLQHAQIPLHMPDSQFKFLHQKTLLLDQDRAIVMTFNFTRSSFSKERNFALLITYPAMVQEIQRVFDADWEQKKVTVQQPNLVWSPDNSRKKIMAFIREAKSEIKIYTQNIEDYEMIGALADAARNNVKVQILLSEAPTKKRLKYLTRAGVEVHESDSSYIHAKVIIVDQKIAILGSINLTKTSLDENRELSVITEDKKIIHQLSELFDRDLVA